MKRDEKGKFVEPDPAPCPWCGGATMIEDGWKGGGWRYTEWNGSHFVQCQECGARGPDLNTRLAARKEWDEISAQHAPKSYHYVTPPQGSREGE